MEAVCREREEEYGIYVTNHVHICTSKRARNALASGGAVICADLPVWPQVELSYYDELLVVSKSVGAARLLGVLPVGLPFT